MSDIIKGDGIVTFVPNSDVVSTKVLELRAEIDSVLSEESFKYVELDLKLVNIIDSSGIGVLISVQNKLMKIGGALKVINVAKDIHTMFKIMRLDKHFEIKTVE